MLSDRNGLANVKVTVLMPLKKEWPNMKNNIMGNNCKTM